MSAMRSLYFTVILITSMSPLLVAGSAYCSGGELDQATINDVIIDPLNAHRTKVMKGEQVNGNKADTPEMLPKAKNMSTISWSCDLELAAITLLNGTCPGSVSAPSGSCDALYAVGGVNDTDIRNVFNTYITNIDIFYFYDITGDVKYSGEYELKQYGNLINSKTSGIGCTSFKCTNSNKETAVVLCLTNQECLQNGDIVYEREIETTTESTTTASTAIYATETTSSASTNAGSAMTDISTTDSLASKITTTVSSTTQIAARTTAGLTTDNVLTTTAAIASATTVRTGTITTSIMATSPILTTARITASTTESATQLGTTITEEPNTLCPSNNGMIDSLRLAFLTKHNTLRTRLALGTVSNGKSNNTCRKASKMPTLVYCCELEKTAIDRAKLCDQMDSVPQGNLIENNYNFTENLNRTLVTAANNAAQLWWSEITKLESGIDQIQNLYYTHLGINSFAKMASDLTTGLGCAVVHCGNRINVVCHYETTLANAVKLYTCGPTCNRCENGTTSCVNGLCPAASETCSAATTTAAPEATATTTEPNTLCPNNHGMTDPLRFAILAKHNSLRTALALGTVENGQTGVMCRKASKMPTLTYDCNLECTALARASKCSQMDSTLPQCISENSYNFTKNLNRTLSQAANAATQVWWSELAALESGIDQIQNLFYTHLGISSFAKIASDLTTKIGCAVVHCNDLINVVCHYQTNLTNAVKLYTAGPTCKKCENGTDSCVNALCPASSE